MFFSYCGQHAYISPQCRIYFLDNQLGFIVPSTKFQVPNSKCQNEETYWGLGEWGFMKLGGFETRTSCFFNNLDTLKLIIKITLFFN